MPTSFDQFMPRTRLDFPDGSALSIGTVSCEDQIHQAVCLAFTPAGSSGPTMELELPPKSVEVIIRQLQEHANRARFINGTRMLEYPEPYPVPPSGAARRKRKPSRSKAKKSRKGVARDGSPDTRPGNPAASEEPPPAR